MLPSQLPEIDQPVVFDTETSGRYPDAGARVSVVSVAWTDPDTAVPCAHAWPFSQDLHGKPEAERIFRKKRLGDQCGPDVNLPPEEWVALIEWLAGRPGLIGANVLFDVLVTEAGTCPPRHQPGVDLSGLVVWDTMIGQRILDPEHEIGLKPTIKRLRGIEDEERDTLIKHLKSRGYGATGGKSNPRYDLASWDVMGPYATWDAVQTLWLARNQWERFHDGEAKFARMTHEMDVLRTLVRMERRGVPYRADESLQWAQKLQVEIDRLAGDLPFEDKPNTVRQFFFGAGQTPKGATCLELRPVKMTKGGPTSPPVASVDAEVMRELAEKEIPAAQLYRETSLLTDANSRYYRGYAEAIGPDGRLRTRFRQTGTRPGRLSCERTNLQAIPHDHRILASGNTVLASAPSPRALIHGIPGYRLWHMDLAQAELRVASLYAGCERMLGLIRQGRDPHGETAIELNLATGPDHPEWYKMRGVGKRGNFSLIFGIGPDKFRQDLKTQVGVDLGQSRTRKLVQDWNDLYPEFKRAIGTHMRHAERHGWTPIRDGIRRYYSAAERAYHEEHKAFNSKVQGNLGYFGRAWMVGVDRLLMDAGVDTDLAGLLLNIHDALVVMVPDTPEGEALVQQCAQIARDLWIQWFPGVPGDVDVSPWSKAA